MIAIDGILVNVTIFPDGTSQVWKLDQRILDYVNDTNNKNIIVDWIFTSENELFHILQLFHLLHTLNEDKEFILSMPFLPYGRQDKHVSNTSTFALETFLSVLLFTGAKILTFDPHSEHLLDAFFGESGYSIIFPDEMIEKSALYFGAELLCFPDVGAKTRYAVFSRRPFICLEKVRDQETGTISGIKVSDGYDVDEIMGKKVLIVDDICDGGKTFIEASKVLYEHGAISVGLYTSHGIYSKGLEILRMAGIKAVYDKYGTMYD